MVGACLSRQTNDPKVAVPDRVRGSQLLTLVHLGVRRDWPGVEGRKVGLTRHYRRRPQTTASVRSSHSGGPPSPEGRDMRRTSADRRLTVAPLNAAKSTRTCPTAGPSLETTHSFGQSTWRPFWFAVLRADTIARMYASPVHSEAASMTSSVRAHRIASSNRSLKSDQPASRRRPSINSSHCFNQSPDSGHTFRRIKIAARVWMLYSSGLRFTASRERRSATSRFSI